VVVAALLSLPALVAVATVAGKPSRSRKPLEFGVEPISKQTELVRRDFARSDATEKVMQQRRRKILPANLRHFAAAGRRIRA